MTEVLSELRGLRTYVGERFDSLDNRFAGMDIRLTQLEEDVGYIRQSFDLPPPPPPSQSLVYNFLFKPCILAMVFKLSFSELYLSFGIWTLVFYDWILCGFELCGFGLYFGYDL